MSGAAWPARYEIRVEGVLDQHWTAWFEGLEIGSDDSQTVISGPVADQAALHGLLNRVCDLGLVLMSVRRSELDLGLPGLRTPGTDDRAWLALGAAHMRWWPWLRQGAGQRVKQAMAGAEVACGGPEAPAGDELESGGRGGPAVDVQSHAQGRAQRSPG